MSAIQNDWLEPLQKEFQKPYYRDLFSKVKEEYNTTTVYPPAEDLFNAFHMTPFSKVKVVILGQDPYHDINQAHGLCFSVKKEIGCQEWYIAAMSPSEAARLYRYSR